MNKSLQICHESERGLYYLHSVIADEFTTPAPLRVLEFDFASGEGNEDFHR